MVPLRRPDGKGHVIGRDRGAVMKGRAFAEMKPEPFGLGIDFPSTPRDRVWGRPFRYGPARRTAAPRFGWSGCRWLTAGLETGRKTFQRHNAGCCLPERRKAGEEPRPGREAAGPRTRRPSGMHCPVRTGRPVVPGGNGEAAERRGAARRASARRSRLRSMPSPTSPFCIGEARNFGGALCGCGAFS